MREYELRKGLTPDLEKILLECFGNAEREGSKIVATFGALKKLTAQIEKNKLYVETEMDKNVDTKVAEETIKRYNKFLELATGYSAKERAKKLQKLAKEGKL
ncbi:MAG: DUF5611 family protein [Candidatus Thermoplasmatota archaeon]